MPLRRILSRLQGPSMPSSVVLLARFVACHGRLPNLLRPALYNDKILYRIMFDRSPSLRVMANKYAVRDFVESRLDRSFLPKLLYVTALPNTIPFEQLPDRFVVKPNHGANWVRVISDKSKLDRQELIRTCEGWLAKNYYEITREWAYDRIPPVILVEELIDDGNGITPHDYKLFVFYGRTEFILVVMGRFEERFHVVMTPQWVPVDVVWPACGKRRTTDMPPPPPHLQQMLEAARRLGRDTDFARIDFYDTEEKLFFGEMTMTPGCAGDVYEPRSFDRKLGGYWVWRRPSRTKPVRNEAA